MGEHPSKPLPTNQAAFELAAMKMICQNSVRYRDVIRKQLVDAKIVRRWGSGAGFYTDYETLPDVPLLPSELPVFFGHVTFELRDAGDDGEAYGPIGCYLHVHGGLIDCLECYSFTGNWPKDWYVWRDTGEQSQPSSANE